MHPVESLNWTVNNNNKNPSHVSRLLRTTADVCATSNTATVLIMAPFTALAEVDSCASTNEKLLSEEIQLVSADAHCQSATDCPDAQVWLCRFLFGNIYSACLIGSRQGALFVPSARIMGTIL